MVEALAVQLVEDNAALRIDQGLIGDPEFLKASSLPPCPGEGFFVAAANKGNKRKETETKVGGGWERVSAHVRACERSADGRPGLEALFLNMLDFLIGGSLVHAEDLAAVFSDMGSTSSWASSAPTGRHGRGREQARQQEREARESLHLGVSTSSSRDSSHRLGRATGDGLTLGFPPGPRSERRVIICRAARRSPFFCRPCGGRPPWGGGGNVVQGGRSATAEEIFGKVAHLLESYI